MARLIGTSQFWIGVRWCFFAAFGATVAAAYGVILIQALLPDQYRESAIVGAVHLLIASQGLFVLALVSSVTADILSDREMTRGIDRAMRDAAAKRNE
jgi:hypothetical protein